MLHEAGYDYEEIAGLTAPEMRRLLEGRRVDNEIRRMAREHERTDGPAQGRVAPRRSDHELLDDYAARMEQGEVAQNARQN